MNKVIKYGELCPYVVLLIIIFSLKLAFKNWSLYEFWQPIIDDIVLFVLLFFMLLNSSNWYLISKRILYGLIFILMLNIYCKLFGLDEVAYYHWYVTPLIAMVYSLTISCTIEIVYGLYIILWKNGKSNMD